MRLAAAGGELDLEKGALLRVRLGEVDDEEVGQDQVRQGVIPIPVRATAARFFGAIAIAIP